MIISRLIHQYATWINTSFKNVYISKHCFKNYTKYNVKIMITRNVHTMKFDSHHFQALLTPEVKQLDHMFQNYGYELRIAGGAVRDLLLDKSPGDIDFASDATVLQIKDMFKKEGVRIIDNRGESHGTLYIRLNDSVNFHITTLRISRNIKDEYSNMIFITDWQLDSSRRDLTINSMYLGLDGILYDYSHGIEDLKKRRIVFVGNPDLRIQDDYLRILRYFRFYGIIASSENSHEIETIQAIKRNVNGLAGISGERIWVELKKILFGNKCKEIMETMVELGIAPYLGLPKSLPMDEFRKTCANSLSLQPQPMTLLTSLLHDNEDLMTLNQRLKLSHYESNLSSFIISERSNYIYQEELDLYKQLIMVINELKLCHDIQQWTCELFKYKGSKELLDTFQTWNIPIISKKKFKLTKNKPKIDKILDQLKKLRIENNLCHQFQR